MKKWIKKNWWIIPVGIFVLIALYIITDAYVFGFRMKNNISGVTFVYSDAEELKESCPISITFSGNKVMWEYLFEENGSLVYDKQSRCYSCYKNPPGEYGTYHIQWMSGQLLVPIGGELIIQDGKVSGLTYLGRIYTLASR